MASGRFINERSPFFLHTIVKKMHKSFLFLILLIVFSVSFIYPQDTANETEFNIWNDTSITFPVFKQKDKSGKEFDQMNFIVIGTLRFGRDNLRPVDERFGVGINYRINKYISLAPDIFYRGSQPVPGNKSYETRFRMAVVLQKNWTKFSLNHRQQIEYRLRNSRKDDVRYKPRLRLNIPITKEKKEIITPFASVEPYYNITTHKWTRNEIFLGFGKKFNNNVSTDIYYLNVKDASFPKQVHGLGIGLKFRVD